MRLKFKFTVKKMGERMLAVPAGDAIVDFNGMLKLNETSAFIVEKLNYEISIDELVFAVSEKFGCNKDIATENVEYIVKSLKESNLLVE